MQAISNREKRFSITRFSSMILIAFSLALVGCGDKNKDRDDDRPANELYESAKRSLNAGNYDRAILQYKALQTRYPFGRYTEQAQLELAYAYYKNREPESALSTLDRFIRTYPTHPNVDYAYYLKGLTNYDQNVGFLARMFPARVRDRDQSAARDAFNDFNELLRRFPDTRYAADARQRQVFLKNNLAAYEVEVAKYYIRRGAYIAAANRARYVLETYPGTPENADALAALHESYTELGMTQLANDAMSVLELNYPDHYYLTGQKQGKSFWAKLWPFD